MAQPFVQNLDLSAGCIPPHHTFCYVDISWEDGCCGTSLLSNHKVS